MDIDNFKALNDTQGHSAGDSLLQLTVKAIQDHVRAADVVARIGGDEFMLLFPETGFETAQTALDKIRGRLATVVEEHKWPVTFSFGMITFHEPPHSVDHLIKLADNLMYKGKNTGKNMILHEVYGGKGKDRS